MERLSVVRAGLKAVVKTDSGLYLQELGGTEAFFGDLSPSQNRQPTPNAPLDYSCFSAVQCFFPLLPYAARSIMYHEMLLLRRLCPSPRASQSLLLALGEASPFLSNSLLCTSPYYSHREKTKLLPSTHLVQLHLNMPARSYVKEGADSHCCHHYFVDTWPFAGSFPCPFYPLLSYRYSLQYYYSHKQGRRLVQHCRCSIGQCSARRLLLSVIESIKETR